MRKNTGSESIPSSARISGHTQHVSDALKSAMQNPQVWGKLTLYFSENSQNFLKEHNVRYGILGTSGISSECFLWMFRDYLPASLDESNISTRIPAERINEIRRLFQIIELYKNQPYYGELGNMLYSFFSSLSIQNFPFNGKQKHLIFFNALNFGLEQLKQKISSIPDKQSNEIHEVATNTSHISREILDRIHAMSEHELPTLKLSFGEIQNLSRQQEIKREDPLENFLKHTTPKTLAFYEGIGFGMDSSEEFVPYDIHNAIAPDDFPTAQYIPYMRGRHFFSALDDTLEHLRLFLPDEFGDIFPPIICEQIKNSLKNSDYIEKSVIKQLQKITRQDNDSFHALMIDILWELTEPEFRQRTGVTITSDEFEKSCRNILAREVRLVFDRIYHTNNENVASINIGGWFHVPRTAFRHAIDRSINLVVVKANDRIIAQILRKNLTEIQSLRREHKEKWQEIEKAYEDETGISSMHIKIPTFAESLLDSQFEEYKKFQWPTIENISTIFLGGTESTFVGLSDVDIEYVKDLMNDAEFGDIFRDSLIKEIESTPEALNREKREIFTVAFSDMKIQTLVKKFIYDELKNYLQMLRMLKS